MLRDLIKKVLLEAASDSGGAGSYITALQPGLRPFEKSSLQPFNLPVSNYDSPLLQYDSYDGKMDERLDQIKKIERAAKKVTDKIKRKPYMTISDEDGNPINPTPGKHLTFVPLNEWVEINENTVSEDLAVWFGTKKKPKGSSQPKGPWVNICRKKEGGGHPPCGRPEADSKGYPKCRAAGVASKMTDSQKKAACSQKRRAEKTNPKMGTGNSPTMTSYKPRKQNESLELLIKKILREQTEPTSALDLKCMNPYNQRDGLQLTGLIFDNFVSGGLSPKLFLKKSSFVKDEPYEDSNQVRLNFEKVSDDELKRVFNITDENLNLLAYPKTVTQKYYCTTVGEPSADWSNFFSEHNIYLF